MNAPTLAEIRASGDDSFPSHILAGCQTALILFAAGFHGRQDAYWIAEAGLLATCVDIDAARLDEMICVYPRDWFFVPTDAYAYVERADRQWDVVSADPYTAQFDRCAEMLPKLCQLARHAVVLGVGAETVLDIPAGWAITEHIHRSDYKGGVYWALLERE